MKRPSFLNLSSIGQEPIYQDMMRNGVCYVHGTNSSIFNGLIELGAILSMEDIDSNKWFYYHKLKSGELGYTIEALHKDQPIAQGVSLNYPRMYTDSLRYAKLRSSNLHYPVLFGFGIDIEIDYRIIDHPVSKGQININKIIRIYVSPKNLQQTKHNLKLSPSLIKFICPMNELS